MEEDEKNPKIKIAVLGNTKSGKSSLIFRYVNNKLNKIYCLDITSKFIFIKNYLIKFLII